MGNNSATTQSLPGNLLALSPAPAKSAVIKRGSGSIDFSDTFSSVRRDVTAAKSAAGLKPRQATTQPPTVRDSSAPDHQRLRDNQPPPATPTVAEKESVTPVRTKAQSEASHADSAEPNLADAHQDSAAAPSAASANTVADAALTDEQLAEPLLATAIVEPVLEAEKLLMAEDQTASDALRSADALAVDETVPEELASSPVGTIEPGPIDESDPLAAVPLTAMTEGSVRGMSGVKGDGVIGAKSTLTPAGSSPVSSLGALNAETSASEGEAAKLNLSSKAGELNLDTLPKDAFARTLMTTEGLAQQLDGKPASVPGQTPVSPAAGLEAMTRVADSLAPAARSFVVQTGVAPQVGQPQWSQAVGERVLWLAAQNLSVAELRLDPPELGPMQVRVVVQQDQVQVNFTSAHASVREALDQGAARLREMFSEQGLNLNVEVSDQSLARRDKDEGGTDGRSDADAEAGADAVVAETDVRSIHLIDHYA